MTAAYGKVARQEKAQRAEFEPPQCERRDEDGTPSTGVMSPRATRPARRVDEFRAPHPGQHRAVVAPQLHETTARVNHACALTQENIDGGLEPQLPLETVFEKLVSQALHQHQPAQVPNFVFKRVEGQSLQGPSLLLLFSVIDGVGNAVRRPLKLLDRGANFRRVLCFELLVQVGQVKPNPSRSFSPRSVAYSSSDFSVV